MKIKKYSIIICLTILVCIGFSVAGTSQTNTVRIKDNKAIYETPAAYEIMNVAIALTDTNIYSGNINVYYTVTDTSKPYYKEVMAYFSAYKNHTLIKALNKHLHKNLLHYLYNLQKGYNSELTGNEVSRNIQFPFFQRLLYNFNSVSRHLMESFAKESNFQKFYEDHTAYYQRTLEDAKNKLNISKVSGWLEKEFTAKYDRFNIVISPLMYSVHFTKDFSDKGEKVSAMWVSDSYGYDPKIYSEQQMVGLYTGIVFTEIDHNYVNPVSDKYKAELNLIMGDQNRTKWINDESGGKFYGTGYKIFNEYMTHAVFLVYTNSLYTNRDQTVIENARIKLMEQKRKYSRFGDFYKQLKMLYSSKKENETITDLYPAMLEWCKKQN